MKTNKQNTRESELLGAALEYAAQGWPVFPVYPPKGAACSCGKDPCSSAGKHPLVAHGRNDATTDEETIRGWWSKWPGASIGLATGAESDVIVIDVDPRHGGTETLAAIQDTFGKLPQTLVAESGGGGLHFFFTRPAGGLKNQASKLGPGLDVRGDGGYVLLAPSGHVSGKQYRWVDAEAPTLPIPDDLLQAFRETPRPPAEDSPDSSLIAHDTPEQKLSPVPEGQRNNQLAAIAGQLRRRGLSEQAIVAALLVMNEEVCQPPLSEHEVRQVAKSISRYERGKLPEPEGEPIDPDSVELALSLGSFLMRALEPGEEIIPNLYRGELMLVNALPDAGKSTLMLNLCLKLAAGSLFPPLIKEAKARRVLYLDFENRPFRAQTDLSKMMGELDPQEQKAARANFHVSVDSLIESGGLCLTNQDHLNLVADYCRKLEVDLVVVDTYAASVSLWDENSNSEVGRKVVRPLVLKMREVGAAVALIHHVGKKSDIQQAALYSGRGATALAAAARLIINLEPDENEQNRVTVKCAKVKGEKFKDTDLILNRETRWFEPVAFEPRPKLTNEEMVIETVQVPMTAGQIAGLLAGMMDRTTTWRILKRLVDRGRLTFSNGRYAPDYRKQAEEEKD